MKKEEEIIDLNENISSSVRFLGSVLAKTDGFVRHLDSQSNMLLGISSAVFVFSASQIKNNDLWVFFLIVCLFSFVSSIISLLAIHPPKYMRKRDQAESLMYNKKIASFDSPGDYSLALSEILGDQEKITGEVGTEIYNLCKYYYRPKRKMFNLSRNVFFFGLFVAILAFFANLIWVKFF